MANNSENFETIEAVDVTLAQNQSSDAPAVRPRLTAVQGYLIASFCLAAIALVVVILQGQNRTSSAPDSADLSTQLPPSPSLAVDGPFQEQQLTIERRAAQDILAVIIQKQKFLMTNQVERWAKEDYDNALKAAQLGDNLYRTRDFAQALQNYRKSEALLSAIEQRLEPLLSQYLSEGRRAIESGNVAAAKSAFTQVLDIDPDNEVALRELQRSEQLPQVLVLIADARQALGEGQFASALKLFKQALSLDGNYAPAVSGALEAETSLNEANFKNAMNKGYRLLQQLAYPAAKEEFRRALSFKPDSPDAINALNQTENEFNQTRINNLLINAKKHEQEENWLDASQTYQQILAIDHTVIAAKIGGIRSDARAELDKQLTQLIADPLRLSSTSVARQGKQLLTDARSVKPAGRRLGEQVEQLETLINAANTPQSITFLSDRTTVVSVLKVGDLGKFEEKIIPLKPGRYVAQGVRVGYRDVRVNFTVGLDQNNVAILVACREAI